MLTFSINSIFKNLHPSNTSKTNFLDTMSSQQLEIHSLGAVTEL